MTWIGRRRWLLSAVTLLATAAPAVVAAQAVPPLPPTSQPRPATPPPRNAQDSSEARKDSLRKAPLVNWEPLDSVAADLMSRKGYSVVRYKAADISFSTSSHTITLTGTKDERAAVQKEPTLLVADTIRYTDTSTTLRASGGTITMRDPSRGEDFIAHQWFDYDTELKQGTAGDVETSAQQGVRWIVKAHRAAFSGDTAAAGGSVFYGRDGIITSCDDSIPHYDFVAKEMKRISGNWIVARPAVLYVEGVPVMWLPFIFQDARTGRRSGMLTPRFGLAELFRNSPTYRRNVENVGYYFALSQFYDGSASLDWRSAAGAAEGDPGWLRLNGEVRYRWLERFVSGRLALSRHALSDGSTNTTLSWSHQQDFSIHSRFTSNLNYSSSTQILRQTAINPLLAIATIASQLNYQREMGNFSMSLGGTRRQYPGRPQIDQDFPSLSISAKPINVTSWALWTPSFSTSSSASLHLDAQGDFARSYFTRSDGTVDSTKVDRNTRNSQLTFNTPFKFLTPFANFELQVDAFVKASDLLNSFPSIKTLVDPADTSRRINRVYARTYRSEVDFGIGFGLPSFFQGTWNLSPSVSLQNVDPNSYFVRTERTGAEWVAQSKRLSYALGISPTFYAITPGNRFRHSISPSFSYSYSPAANVSSKFLEALGNRPGGGYLGNLAQNRISMSLAQNIEAKVGPATDSITGEPIVRKAVKVLSMQFTSLTYDFERARVTGKGIATDRFGYTLRSELLPGFDFGSDYSLFQGNVLSDTAKFSPYLESIRASFSLNAQSAVVRLFGRLFGAGVRREPAPDTAATDSLTATGRGGSRLAGTQQVAGQQMRSSALSFTPDKGFDASFTFTKNQQRPVVGGLSREYDPTIQCQSLKDFNPFQYEQCVQNALFNPPTNTTTASSTLGGIQQRIPPQTNIQARTSFNLTDKWSASWSTNYDMERAEFGAQTVSLQRDLHDWRALFGFTQSPNGNFAFTFLISLKAEPDIKFNYDRANIRQAGTSP